MRPQLVPRSLIGLALSTGLFSLGLFGQGGHPPPGGPSNGGAGARGPSVPSGQPSTGTTSPDFSQHPLFLSGKVSMEDGTAPPDSAVIQLICHSSPRSVGRTDSRGDFSIDVNNRLAGMAVADASENASPSFGSVGGGGSSPSTYSNTAPGTTGASSSRSNRDVMGCDLQASLPGFRSDVLHLGESRDDFNVGTLILHRLANVDGTTISVTSALAPKEAKKAMERAQNFVKKEKWDQAQKELRKAVEIYPKYAVAWAELGRVEERLNDFDGARKSSAMALEADGKLVTPYLTLASVASREEKWQDVSDYTDRALKLNPVDFPQAYLLNSMSNFYLKRMEAAERSAREGIDHDAEHRFPRMNEVLGAVLMQKKDYAGAAEQYRKFLRYAPEGSDTATARKQLADLERSLSPEAKKQ
ncbi:MAG TPA: tetratricopeptide repeat protein [Bryobacteraceae bacterium]|nr:tetratricopeptide repeat protein [Bryobacteraceae bacterium]